MTMFSWSTVSFSLLCVFVVCPDLIWGVPRPWRWMSRSTGGFSTCHSPFSLSHACPIVLFPLCYLFIPFVLFVGAGFLFPGVFGVLVHPRFRLNVFDGLLGMSGGHCIHPTRGPAISLKHKKLFHVSLLLLFFAWVVVLCMLSHLLSIVGVVNDVSKV